jgi:transposase
MAFLRFKKKRAQAPVETGRVGKTKKTIKRASPLAMEVKLLALEALEGGMSAQEVGDLLSLSASTIHNWRVAYTEGGVQGLARKASSIAVRHQCSVLEERIVAQRQANPDHGVRRIRDDLRRHEGLEVSAEKVRTTVNGAGLGNPPPQPHRRPPQVRRFERVCPNALWQIDIFTFQLKRMYQVYLVGIIDDHSRYITGWGLFRQQTADAVLEVTKGAIGQWGAPREILSDNGRQFVAWRGETRFQKVLKQQGIGHVVKLSSPPSPMPVSDWTTGSTTTTIKDLIRGSTEPVLRTGFTGWLVMWTRPLSRAVMRTPGAWPLAKNHRRPFTYWHSWVVRMCGWFGKAKISK